MGELLEQLKKDVKRGQQVFRNARVKAVLDELEYGPRPSSEPQRQLIEMGELRKENAELKKELLLAQKQNRDLNRKILQINTVIHEET